MLVQIYRVLLDSITEMTNRKDHREKITKHSSSSSSSITKLIVQMLRVKL